MPRAAHLRATVPLLAALTALSGCSINDYEPDPNRERTPIEEMQYWSSPSARSPNEVPTTPPDLSSRRVTDPAPTPALAVERFAQRYTNWTYETLASNQRRLAAMSVGEASAMHARAARRTPRDYELQRGRIANHGEILAIAPIRPPRKWTWVVVTRERTTGARVYDDLRPSHHVTVATTQPVKGGWVLSRWEPQS